MNHDKNPLSNNFSISKNARIFALVALSFATILTLLLPFISIFTERSELSTIFDVLISTIYFCLFFFLLWLAEDKKLFFSNNWWMLLAAIPSVIYDSGEGLWHLIAVILSVLSTIVRVIVLVKLGKWLVKKSYSLQVTSFLTLFIMISTSSFYLAERNSNPEVTTYFDSFYWTIVTGTTVGYGDITPITTQGRMVAIAVMIFGIGIFGAVTGGVASLLSERARSNPETTKN